MQVPDGQRRRYLSAVAMADGSIILTGGGMKPQCHVNLVLHDTWRSTNNGATWTLMNANSGWSGRFGHTTVALPDGSIVLIAGYAPNDSVLRMMCGGQRIMVQLGHEKRKCVSREIFPCQRCTVRWHYCGDGRQRWRSHCELIMIRGVQLITV